MENDYWYDCFIEALHEKYPDRTQLVQELVNLLSIEREAVYRRLRREVVFPFPEAVKIAFAWKISLDRIVNIDSGQVPFTMRSMNFLSPTRRELFYLREKLNDLHLVGSYADSEYMEICNKLPRSVITGFTQLYRFDLFKWSYEYGDREGEVPRPFTQTVIPAEIQQMMPEHFRSVKNIAGVNYIWDQRLLNHLVHDIQYFHSIQMITGEEKELIRQDLYALLDYLFEIVNNGYFRETGNKVNLYISRINLDTNYSYLYTEELKFCRVHVFNKHEIYTYDEEMTNNFKSWMQLKKKSSILISEVDQKSKIKFFAGQRRFIDNL